MWQRIVHIQNTTALSVEALQGCKTRPTFVRFGSRREVEGYSAASVGLAPDHLPRCWRLRRRTLGNFGASMPLPGGSASGFAVLDNPTTCIPTQYGAWSS